MDRGMTIEHVLLLVLATLWGASYSLIKVGVETIPPVSLIAGRTLIAAALLLGVARWRGIRFPRDRETWRRFFIQACLNSTIPFTLIAWGERRLNAGLATVLNSTAPIFVFLLTVAITRHEPVTLRKLFGVASGMAGVCLIVGSEALSGLDEHLLGEQVLAPLAIVAATICYAGAAIFGKTFKDLDPILPAAGSLICGAVILVPASLVVDQPWTLVPSRESIFALI